MNNENSNLGNQIPNNNQNINMQNQIQNNNLNYKPKNNKKENIVTIVSLVSMIISLLLFLILYYAFKREFYMLKYITINADSIFATNISVYIYIHAIVLGFFNFVNLIVVSICYLRKRISKLLKVCTGILVISIVINIFCYLEARQTYRDLYIREVYNVKESLENVTNNLYNTKLNLDCEGEGICVKYFFEDDIKKDLQYQIYERNLKNLGNSTCQYFISGVKDIDEILYNAELKCSGMFEFSTIKDFDQRYEELKLEKLNINDSGINNELKRSDLNE